MCLACEQEAMWFAYLRRRGLITADGQFVEEPPSLFVAEPLEATPAQPEVKDQSAPAPQDNSAVTNGDPTAG
jgi:hypothetical protein